MKTQRIIAIFTILTISNFGWSQFNSVKNPEKLGGSVNTQVEESMPIFDKESATLFFVRSLDQNSKGGKNDQDIWSSAKEEDFSYSKAESLKELNNKYNNAIIGMNKTGDKVYLLNSYEGKRDLKKGISVSTYKGKKWGKPKEIKIPELDIEGNFYGFHINAAENAIVISYLGPDSEGNEDLYVSLLDDKGKWSKPMHLGENVNSKDFEISPYLSPNDDTLFFSSDGFKGEGDADIFYVTRTSDSWTDWSKPVNIGPKINSPKFDAYFTYSGNNYYWSSNRDEELADIYYTTLIPPLFADITSTDVTKFKGSDGTVNVTPKGGTPPYSYKWENGQLTEDLANVPKGIYKVIVSDFYGQTVNLTAPVNEPIPVVNLSDAIIYFDVNSSYLNPQNKIELDEFATLLSAADPNVRFEIISHCDSRNTEDYNIWLGEKRLNRTIDYLASKGVDRSRLKGNQYGENQPEVKCENCTERQFTLNRRTTIKVIRP
jgi:outer membrane protein OmpA-like peptidoglycan-associated protein